MSFFHLSKNTNPPGCRGANEPHVHAHDEVLLCVEGRGGQFLDGVEYEMERGDLFYYPAGSSVGACVLDPYNWARDASGTINDWGGERPPSNFQFANTCYAEFVLTKNGFPNEIAQNVIPGVGNQWCSNSSAPRKSFNINAYVWVYIGGVVDL